MRRQRKTSGLRAPFTSTEALIREVAIAYDRWLARRGFEPDSFGQGWYPKPGRKHRTPREDTDGDTGGVT